ncbi:MAG: type IV pilin protein [Betaproteobacteria bacterium]
MSDAATYYALTPRGVRAMPRIQQSSVLRTRGFTLIEVMVVVAIVGILAAIAIPNYSESVMRGKLMEAQSKLADLRSQQERYFMDNRTYQSGANCGIDDAAILATANYNGDTGRAFDVSCAAPSATTYTLTATGRAAKGMGSFVLTVNQANVKSAAGPAPWVSATCWFIRKNGECS